ncbi:conserved hypothetical protein [Ricinus communis]|uniref:Uncharacterized protein n=1 Tax=Ricinus communis TaxID=3988 RepID=B9STD5_RICCO|nr:conserved hypothetical protein [Ricinus communis]
MVGGTRDIELGWRRWGQQAWLELMRIASLLLGGKMEVLVIVTVNIGFVEARDLTNSIKAVMVVKVNCRVAIEL